MTPKMALGTYRLTTEQAETIVYEAIKLGYRKIDTAAVYRNEVGVGKAIHRAINDQIVTRDEIFVTTKVKPKDQGFDKCINAVQKSLKDLSLEYIDLVLLHWPGTQGIKFNNPKNKDNRIGSVNALHKLWKDGLIKSYGVSNFNVYHFEGLEVPVHVNQIEFHPLLWNHEETLKVIEYCKSNNIALEAYSSLGEGKLLDPELYPELAQIAKKHGCTIAQVLIKYGIDKGFSVMPKASSIERLLENFESTKVQLDSKDLDLIDSIPSRVGHTKFCWDPLEIK